MKFSLYSVTMVTSSITPTGIDTRSLTKKIREHGTMLGKIITGDTDPDTIEFVNPDLQNLVTRVSCPTVKNYNRGQ